MNKKTPGILFAFTVILVFSAFLAGCATGAPLTVGDLNTMGWDNTEPLQCYLSTKLTLTKLPGAPGSAEVNFDENGAVIIRNAADARWTIVLPTSLQGRIINSNKKDLLLYVAFEEGNETLTFYKNDVGEFTLMLTVDGDYENGTPFVEYEGFRYKPVYGGSVPKLNVIINKDTGQNNLRRQMQGTTARASASQKEAVDRSASKLIEEIPSRATVAVLAVSAQNAETAESIVGELELYLVDSKKFVVVDRKNLDTLRKEQKFQLSGEVDDDSAVSLGKLVGAQIIITGSISGTGSTRNLELRALDVETSQIISITRESF
jgi:hypothetical protein